MEIVPVIDLKRGLVVRARQGDRASYRPIESPLSRTSEAVDVVAGLLSLYPFKTLYIADLDAIEGTGDAGEIITNVGARFPQLALWIDNGCHDSASADALLSRYPGATLVLGSESQADSGLIREFRNHPRIIVSLDFRDDNFLGPPTLLAEPGLWPERVVVMTLGRVGSGAGPDLARLGEIRRRADGRHVFMAGGLRGRDDLPALAANGAAGILVASALHDGRLSQADLMAFSDTDGG